MKPEPPERKLELSTTQVVGSALAAMSGAFFASWAGTTGTIVGAAMGSVIVTVGAATYTWSLRRTRDAVKRTAAQVRQGALVGSTLPRTTDDTTLATDLPEGTGPSRVLPTGLRTGLPWGKVALTSVAVMAVGLGGITAIEAVTGRPVSSYTGSTASTGTTLGDVLGSGGTSSKQQGSRSSTAGESGETSSTQQDSTDSEDSTGSGQDATGEDSGSGTGRPTQARPTTPADPEPTTAPTPSPDPATTDTATPDPESSTQP